MQEIDAGKNGLIKLPIEPVESARAVGLRYVADEAPGFQRQKNGQGCA